MHRSNFFSSHVRAVALLLSLCLILTAVLGGTFAQLITQTPSLFNTFLSGLDPTGDLVVRKAVTHPFGDSYQIPETAVFTFTVDLGESYAGKTLETSQGEKQADENGCITLSVKPDEAVRVSDLLAGTSVTITEAPAAGFTPDGGAVKTFTVVQGENSVTYTNDYTPSPVAPVNLTVTGTKLLEGRDWQEGDSFTFLLEYKLAGAGTVWQELGTAAVTYERIEVEDPEEPGKTIWVEKPDFDKFSFTDLIQSIRYSSAGIYSFRLSEVEGAIGGISYDKAVSYFDVLVGDADMDGLLEIQSVDGFQNTAVSYADGVYNVDMTVCNQYAPEGTAQVTLNIDKTVQSLSGEAKSFAGYTFELYDEDGDLVATSVETSAAGETCIRLTYDAKDAGKTFHYTLKETHSGEKISGMTYDGTVYHLSVSVVDDLDGTVSAYIYDTADDKTEQQAPEPEETEPSETTETTEAPTEESTEATEQTTEETTDTAAEPTEETTVPTEEIVETTETTADPTEEAIEPTQGSSEPTQEPTAPTEETQPHSSASAPRTDVFAVENIVIIPEGAADSYTVSFRNVYDPTDVSVSFEGRKELSGRSLRSGEFDFALYSAGEDFAVTEGTKPIRSAANNADGKFAFSAVTYDKVGVYRYVVKEDASQKLPGVTYDATVFHVIVTVTDENGALKATVAVTDDLGASAEIVFCNTYAPASAFATFAGQKKLIGAKLEANMFSFLLYQADENFAVQGAALAGAANDESGNFAFDQVKFSAAGTYYYVVREDSSAQTEGMTYDDTTYGIKVTVFDNDQGQLIAETTLCKVGGQEVSEIVFENRYVEPEKPTEPATKPTDPTDTPDEPTETTNPTETEPPTTKPTKPTKPSDKDAPATGDQSHVDQYIIIMVVSFAAIVVLLLTRKRRKKSKKGGRYLH